MTRRYAVVAASVFVVLLGLILLATSVARVEAGEVCVVTRNGAATGLAEPGLNLKPSIFGGLACFSTRMTTYETVADMENNISKAQYIDYPSKGKTNEGLNYEVTYILQYHLPPENAETVYAKYKTDDSINENLVKARVRALIPNTLDNYSADKLYLGDLNVLSDEVEDLLRADLESQGIELDWFELKKPNLDNKYEEAIEAKALKVEETKQKVLEQGLAQEEAERQRIQAEGDAAQQMIVANQQAEAAIVAAQAEAEKTTIQAQAEADKKELSADAEAYRVEQTGAALDANPTVLEWEQIQAIRDANVIYLPSDSGVLPIMNIGEGTPTPDE